MIQDWTMNRLPDSEKLPLTLPFQSTESQNVHTYVVYVDKSPEF